MLISVAGAGLVAKTKHQLLFVSVANILVHLLQVPAGLLTIDGVTAFVANDRVLLVGQTNPIQNGLWACANQCAWNATDRFCKQVQQAGQAYCFLFCQGQTNGGSSWFVQVHQQQLLILILLHLLLFSLSKLHKGGANVGAGTGLIFRK